MTQYEKMISGELYDATCEDLLEKRLTCREILRKYNTTSERKPEELKELLNQLTQKQLKNVYIQAPFYCDYGINLELGENVFMNFNCTILDCAKVTIGENTLLGPNVQIYTPLHPIDAGDNSIIGAGSVVTKDIPPNVIAVGNPCKVIKTIEPTKQ